MIYFIRHGKHLLPYRSHDEMPFNVLADLASGKLNPRVDVGITARLIANLANKIPLQRVDVVFCSPSKRCYETALLIADYCARVFQKKVQVSILAPLHEINFDLKRICTMTNFEHYDLGAINDSVFQAMASGKYCEHVSYAYKRISLIFDMLSQMPDAAPLFVTHDFFMRVIELFIRNHGKSKDIACIDLKNTKRNTYASGFLTNSDLSVFLPF